MNFFITGFLIFCIKYHLAASGPMYGEYVRLAYSEEFPYVVSIKRFNNTNPEPETDHICTGVLVSHKHVLTIENCFDYLENYTTEVLIGRQNIRLCKKYYVAWWMSYTAWATLRNIKPEFLKNDITIIKLKQTVPTTITPATLSSMTSKDLYRSTVEIAGFGMTAEDRMTSYMETVTVSIISQRECEERIEKIGQNKCELNKKYLCGVGDPVALMSNGNSGSAVLYNGQLVGIHKGTCPVHEIMYHPEKINLFLSISYYQEYIVDVISNF
ncbi:PREDICTED: chymotrypsin-2-like [Ceratosolen solmsi marchali]|uniref:Chymotrypsin-2-like n=1 Tax=Ceratosolen solmsi marchali TaxID=326594 RepID=A0AAJ6VMN0_9HYME|nr:PREDICTED: chymotrypsin-2-like [Ceratosolen solmsi marchali]